MGGDTAAHLGPSLALEPIPGPWLELMLFFIMILNFQF